MIESYFTGSITIYRPVRDAYNAQTEVRVLYPARIQPTDRAVRGQQGETKQGSYQIWLSADAVVLPEDQIYLGVGEEESGDQYTYPVLSIEDATSFSLQFRQVTV